MLATGALVFGTVVVGGLTRLTESGLSMVDWSLLGTRPPLNSQEWEAYFLKYQQFPEYQMYVHMLNFM
jgi:cytochrome c oxidase assembly protein subunit 15